MKVVKYLFISCFLGASVQAAHENHKHHEFDTGIEHTHSAGEWMLGYNYMNMHMGDLYQDDSKIAVEQVSMSMMTPVKMTMEMHMFHAMYGLNHRQTLMIMANYIDNDMTMRNAMNGNLSKMASNGFSDTQISLLQDVSKNFPYGKQSIINFSLSVPTGAIDETNDMGVRLPYKMQLGSGTFDPSINFSNKGSLGVFDYDYNAGVLFRLGHNSEGYSKGDVYTAAYRVSYTKNKFTLIDELNYELNTRYDGIDNAIESVMMSSIARDATKQAGQILRYNMGLGYELAQKTNLLLEYSLPIYQNLDGPQLGEASRLNFTIQTSF